MNLSIFEKIFSGFMIISFMLSSAGMVEISFLQKAHAQNIVDTVSLGEDLVLDGCEGITGARYASIAATLGIDVGGGIRGGISALGDALAPVGDSILDGLRGIGSRLGDSGIGRALSGIGGIVGTIAGGPAGPIIGGVISGLFGGGGPDPVVEEGLRSLQQQGSKLASFATQQVNEKERCLDALARQAGQQSLRDLTAQSVDWLQSGFEQFGETNNPGFVDDLNQYLSNVAQGEFDRYVMEAGSESAGSFSGVCNFLRQPIFESVGTQFISETGPAGQDSFTGANVVGSSGGCVLPEGVTEAEAQAFLSGDFSAGGGWEGLARSASDPGLSPVTGYLREQSILQTRVAQEKQRQQEELSWGQGFLAADQEGGFTPASVVRGITERLFASDVSRLELIDEMGEIAGDIGNTLIGAISGGSSGLATVKGGDTVGGSQADRYQYLARSITNRVDEQIEIERETRDMLDQILPLYNNEDVDDLFTEIRSCMADGYIRGGSTGETLASATQNYDTFQNTTLQTRAKVDWTGDPFPWIAVIPENGLQPIGWNGSDYDWDSDDVERYANQGFSDQCREGEHGDGGNATYVITQEWIPDPQRDFNGVFLGMQRESTPIEEDWDRTELNQDLDLNTPDGLRGFINQVDKTPTPGNDTMWNRSEEYRNFHIATSIQNDGGVFTVWQKQICAFHNNDSASGAHWQEQSPIVNHEEREHFADTPRGQRRAANAQCDLIEDYEYCISPAYRTPDIITGEMYKENSDGEIKPSSCTSRADAGTHYFVNDRDDTWSTRECRLRQSPEGSAVEWEPGFPDSGQDTGIAAFKDGISENPLGDQDQLIRTLDEIMEDLTSGSSERDILENQDLFYGMRENFNDADTPSTLRQAARRYVRNIRSLNSAALQTQEDNQDNDDFSGCGGIEDLRDFGSEFMQDTEIQVDDEEDEEGEVRLPEINFFSTRGTTSMTVSWSADASSCEASADAAINWDGEVSVTGSEFVQNIPSEGVTVSLTCQRGGEQVTETSFFAPSSSDGPVLQPDDEPGSGTEIQ